MSLQYGIFKPAYDDCYDSEAEVLEAWENGKDFKFIYGSYISNRDIEYLENNFDGIYILYRPMKSNITKRVLVQKFKSKSLLDIYL